MGGRALTRNRTLRKLNFSYNDVTEEGFSRFADLMDEMHGLQVLQAIGEDEFEEDAWEQQLEFELRLLPGIERNYSLLELPNAVGDAAQPFLERNARGYDKARAATIAWLGACRFRK